MFVKGDTSVPCHIQLCLVVYQDYHAHICSQIRNHSRKFSFSFQLRKYLLFKINYFLVISRAMLSEEIGTKTTKMKKHHSHVTPSLVLGFYKGFKSQNHYQYQLMVYCIHNQQYWTYHIGNIKNIDGIWAKYQQYQCIVTVKVAKVYYIVYNRSQVHSYHISEQGDVIDETVLERTWLDSEEVCCSMPQPECHTSLQESKLSFKVEAY